MLMNSLQNMRRYLIHDENCQFINFIKNFVKNLLRNTSFTN